jgi:hypothetical protein
MMPNMTIDWTAVNLCVFEQRLFGILAGCQVSVDSHPFRKVRGKGGAPGSAVVRANSNSRSFAALRMTILAQDYNTRRDDNIRQDGDARIWNIGSGGQALPSI